MNTHTHGPSNTKKWLWSSLFVLLYTSQAASTIIFQSATSAAIFTTDYEAEWFTFVDEEGLPKIRVSVTISNVDSTDWGTQGNMGYWLGIGFGSKNMVDADVIMCAFRYTGTSSSDQFSCFDFYSTEEGALYLDDVDNIIDI